MLHPSTRCCPSRSRGSPPGLALLCTMLVMALLPLASGVDNTRLFLSAFCSSFPGLQSSYTTVMNGNFCNGVSWITCDTTSGPVTIDLTKAGGGSLPEVPSNVNGSAINVVSVLGANSKITGTLPASWGELSQLSNVRLSSNSFTGTLPDSWGKLSAVRGLDLSYNSLTGTLPASWGQIHELVDCVLAFNSITGTVPPEWGKLQKLENLFIGDNYLSGTLPNAWNGMQHLFFFSAPENQLSGALPEWPNMPWLTNVVLDGNLFDGTLSASWSEWPVNFGYVSLQGSQFCGCAPSTWYTRGYLITALDNMGANGAALRAADCATANACGVDRKPTTTAPPSTTTTVTPSAASRAESTRLARLVSAAIVAAALVLRA